MLSVYIDDIHVCVCKVHEFQVVYWQRTVKLERAWGGDGGVVGGWRCGGLGLLQMHRAEPPL